jgi:ClpP class serine protease
MGDVAASGGYYLASAANEILAESNTITGSIGVFGLMFNGESLANDLGVRSVELQRGARPGPDLLRGTTDAERERLQASVDGTYERFLDAVVAGRGTNRMTKDKLRTIAEGHVWTGAQALQHGLVDKEGSFVDALRLARERAGFAADAAVGLAVFSGDDELPGLADLGGMVSVAMGMPRHEAMVLAAKLLFVDPELAAFAASSAGKPMVLAPTIEVR